MDIEIGLIESDVRAVDGNALVDPQVKKQLVREVMKHVSDRETHAHRVRRERDVNAGRTAEDVA